MFMIAYCFGVEYLQVVTKSIYILMRIYAFSADNHNYIPKKILCNSWKWVSVAQQGGYYKPV